MEGLISLCLRFRRSVLLLFTFLLIAGGFTYFSIPRESDPDVQIPLVVVSINYDGASPEDCERLVLRPAEQHLQSIEGVKQIRSTAYQSSVTLLVEFFADMDIDRALTLIRNKINLIKSEIPKDAKEPVVEEINVSLFPVLTVELFGQTQERYLFKVAEDLQEQIERIDKVLEAKIMGSRDEILEIQIDPLMLEKYNLIFADVKNVFAMNNVMAPSGKLRTGDAWFYLKTPSLVQNYQEFFDFPIKTTRSSVVRLKDIASVRKTFKWAHTYANSDGIPSVTLEVKKRIGQNIIQTIEATKSAVKQFMSGVQDTVQVRFSQDESIQIRDMLSELQNNIIFSILLVMLVMIWALGWRSAILVGVAIPASFLSGIFFLGLMKVTLNVVVLFSLILSVGMLVDGAIIVVEYADRKMAEGLDRMGAYYEGAKKMAWPVVSSLSTHTVVFLPLLFWPGIVGKFMRFLPITLICTLGMSLLVALILIPVLGSIFGKINLKDKQKIQDLANTETGPLTDIKGTSGAYIHLLRPLLYRPFLSLIGLIALILSIFFIYSKANHGVEFFPETDPSMGTYIVRLRGNHTAEKKLELMKEVEAKIIGKPNIKSVYTTAGTVSWDDTEIIGRVNVELIDWKERGSGKEIFEQYLSQMKTVPGLRVELEMPRNGPPGGKDIQLSVYSKDPHALERSVHMLHQKLESIQGTKDVDDSRPRPGIDWVVEIDRAKASQNKTSILNISQLVQMMGDGVVVSSYQPNDAKKAIDVILSFPEEKRNIAVLKNMKLPSKDGNLSLEGMINLKPKNKLDRIERTDGQLSRTVSARVESGTLPNTVADKLKAYIENNNDFKDVEIKFMGDQQDQKESGDFLVKAFAVAIFIILIILVTQFNSFFSALLVLSAVVMATAGGLIGLLIMDLPFSIVMGGIAMIALAGVIVSNNIIFIDTFDQLKETKEGIMDVILRTGALRLRPILLTQVTGILGLLPILLRLDIDFVGMTVHQGAPSSAFWVQLATVMSFGLGFGSLITLIFTPCALMAREKYREFRAKKCQES